MLYTNEQQRAVLRASYTEFHNENLQFMLLIYITENAEIAFMPVMLGSHCRFLSID